MFLWRAVLGQAFGVVISSIISIFAGFVLPFRRRAANFPRKRRRNRDFPLVKACKPCAVVILYRLKKDMSGVRVDRYTCLTDFFTFGNLILRCRLMHRFSRRSKDRLRIPTCTCRFRQLLLTAFWTPSLKRTCCEWQVLFVWGKIYISLLSAPSASSSAGGAALWARCAARVTAASPKRWRRWSMAA